MKLRDRTLEEIAELICGNGDQVPFLYRSSSKLTRFFRDIDTDFVHTVSKHRRLTLQILPLTH